jgi:hypothetical protein
MDVPESAVGKSIVGLTCAAQTETGSRSRNNIAKATPLIIPDSFPRPCRRPCGIRVLAN